MVKMAFYDDRKFLLSHIHHSFITCDDTGMCEMAMLNEVVTDSALHDSSVEDSPQSKVLDYYSNTLESELLEAGQSYDIVSGMGFLGGHRNRSNTAQRLERMKKERQIQAKITHVPWKECGNELSEKELSHLFPKKPLDESKEKKLQVKSALSEALELYPAAPNNPFGEYARFDGRINQTAPTKKMLIYLTMLPEEERNYGMPVICLSNAKIHDLIGLICWMYTNEGKEPKLKPNVANYCLKIAEETGEVDEDFPSLDVKEFVGKFGFEFLALVERPDKSSTVVIMHIEDECKKLEVPNLDMRLRDVVGISSHKPANKLKGYHIEKLEEPGVSLSLDSRLIEYNTLVFRLVFEDSARTRTLREIETEEYNSHMKAVEAPLYQSYNVSFCQSIGLNYDVQLGISGEKVEINPLPQKGPAKLLTRQQKPATYYMDSIAACEIVSKKYSPGKSIFRMVHQNKQEFRKYIFETDPQTADDIVKKVQIILDMRSSNSRKEYQLYRERKLQKKLQKSHHNNFAKI